MLDVESDITGEGPARRIKYKTLVVFRVAQWIEVPADGVALGVPR